MRVLLLSAYDAPSHKRWREGLISYCSDYDWQVLALPARYFSWRIRGNPLSWWSEHRDVLSQDFDVLIATSMVDLSTMIALFPNLSHVPRLLYFHENQFAYPVSSAQHKSVEPAMVSIYAALTATRLCFNSEYNRQTFLQGVTNLLSKMPDHVPLDLAEILTSKSEVLAVPLEDVCFCVCENKHEREYGHIVWNHRWEYDKSPDRLLALIKQLPEHLPLTFHIVGQSFRQQPAEFTEIHQLLVERNWLGCWGYMDDVNAYRALLQRSHMVLSTAIHDFQGLAVLEAVAAGACPIVPDRLAYQELFPSTYRYASESTSVMCMFDKGKKKHKPTKKHKHKQRNAVEHAISHTISFNDEIASCVDLICRMMSANGFYSIQDDVKEYIQEGVVSSVQLDTAQPNAPDVSELSWSHLGGRYTDTISDLASSSLAPSSLV